MKEIQEAIKQAITESLVLVSELPRPLPQSTLAIAFVRSACQFGDDEENERNINKWIEGIKINWRK